jgi:hypothetical protein
MSRPALALSIVDRDEETPNVIIVGDIVRSGVNRYPYYRVIAINGERAWVRDIQYGTDCVVAIAGFHRI